MLEGGVGICIHTPNCMIVPSHVHSRPVTIQNFQPTPSQCKEWFCCVRLLCQSPARKKKIVIISCPKRDQDFFLCTEEEKGCGEEPNMEEILVKMPSEDWCNSSNYLKLKKISRQGSCNSFSLSSQWTSICINLMDVIGHPLDHKR